MAANEQQVATKETQGFGVITAERSAELASVAVASSARAEVEAAYVMALRNPRNEDDARAKIIRACSSPLFAATARYRKPTGKKEVAPGRWEDNHVVGPSIRFAEEMLRCWKNVLTQQTAIYDDSNKRIVRITTRDLEANTAYSKEITLDKTVERSSDKGREVLGQRLNSYNKIAFIVRATEDELMMKESALASKVIRNNGLRLIPQHIIEEAMAEVDRVIREKIKQDPDAERRAILDGFAKRGVMPSDVERFIGCPSMQFSTENLVTLRDMLNSIEDGHATWAEYIEGTAVQTTDEIKEKSQPETKGKTVTSALKKVAEERNVKVETKPDAPVQQEPTQPAQDDTQHMSRKIRDEILNTEQYLKQTPEGTKKFHAVLGAMKVRLTSKQQPLDVIPEEQWEFYLRNLVAAAGQ